MGAKILRWFIFTVRVSLVPFGVVALAKWADNAAFELSSLWPRGELLLVSTALAADAIGDLIPTGPSARSAKVATGGFCLLLILLTSLWYGLIQDHPGYNAGRVSEGSIVIFFVTVVVCLVCKLVAGNEP